MSPDKPLQRALEEVARAGYALAGAQDVIRAVLVFHEQRGPVATRELLRLLNEAARFL